MLKVESFQKKKNYRNNNYKSSHKIYICAHTKYSSQHQCVFECLSDITVGQKILKSPGQKNLVKSNKSISATIFLTKLHFMQFQKWPKINF